MTVHTMNACIPRSRRFGFLVDRAQRGEDVLECLPDYSDRNISWTMVEGLTDTSNPLHRSPFHGSSGSYV